MHKLNAVVLKSSPDSCVLLTTLSSTSQSRVYLQASPKWTVIFTVLVQIVQSLFRIKVINSIPHLPILLLMDRSVNWKAASRVASAIISTRKLDAPQLPSLPRDWVLNPVSLECIVLQNLNHIQNCKQFWKEWDLAFQSLHTIRGLECIPRKPIYSNQHCFYYIHSYFFVGNTNTSWVESLPVHDVFSHYLSLHSRKTSKVSFWYHHFHILQYQFGSLILPIRILILLLNISFFGILWWTVQKWNYGNV